MRRRGDSRMVVATAAALSASLRNGQSIDQVMTRLLQKMRRYLLYSGCGSIRLSKQSQGGGVVNVKHEEILRLTEQKLEHEGGGPEAGYDGRVLGLGHRSFRQNHNSIEAVKDATTKALSSPVIREFLRGFRPRSATESVALNLGEGNLGPRGHFGHHSGWRAGSIRAATFNSADQPIVESGASEPSSGITESSDIGEGSVPTPEASEAKPPPAEAGGQGGSRVGGHTSSRPSTFRRPPQQRTNPGTGLRSPINRSSADGSQKVVVRISNLPRLCFKSDILALLKDCDLKPEDVIFYYNGQYRLKFVQVQFPSLESVRLAQRHLAANSRLGGRPTKLTTEAAELDDINKSLAPFRGRSLLMVKMNVGVITEDVERFFSGYKLDHGHPIKFFRSSYPAENFGAATPGPGKFEIENRVLVRFKTQLEALRALREKQGSFCRDAPIRLKFIE